MLSGFVGFGVTVRLRSKDGNGCVRDEVVEEPTVMSAPLS